MNTSLKTLCAAVLLSGAGSAMAASSVDLTVKGLITPSACEPSLSSGGVYDIGKISAKDLNVDEYTRLPDHTLQLTVTCDAATLMAIEPKDNRAGSSFESAPDAFGLGLVNGNEKLGFMALALSSMVADGVEGGPILSKDAGVTWTRATHLTTDGITSVANTTTIAPIPVQSLTSDLNLYTAIAPANTLTLTNEVAIDGSVTLTVKYL
jgi:type 1 fimbria pilin